MDISRLVPCQHFLLCLESETKETWGLKNTMTLSFSLPVLQMPPLRRSRQMHYLCCNFGMDFAPLFV